VRAYHRSGEAGLASSYSGKGRSLPAPAKQKIVELTMIEFVPKFIIANNRRA
jgi:hypothetical protein